MKKNLFVFLMLAFSTSVFADQHADDQLPVIKETKVDQLSDKLTLTDDQKNKIQASRDKYKTQIAEKEAVYNASKDKFTAAIQNPNSATADLEALYKVQEDAYRALQDTLFQSRMEFRDILTPEQRTKMISKHGEAKDKFRARPNMSKDKPAPTIAKPIQPVPPPPPVSK